MSNQPEPVRTLVIDRATWRRGGSDLTEQFGLTLLLNEQGFKCCLGFDALACGVPKEFLGCGGPNGDAVNFGSWGKALTMGSGAMWTDGAMRINDTHDLSNADREAKLIKHFLSHPMGPVELVFEGEYLGPRTTETGEVQ